MFVFQASPVGKMWWVVSEIASLGQGSTCFRGPTVLLAMVVSNVPQRRTRDGTGDGGSAKGPQHPVPQMPCA